MKNNFFSIYGYPLGGYNPWGDDGKTLICYICPYCGVEWENEDYTQEYRTEYCNTWLATGVKWFEPLKKIDNWSLRNN